MVKMKKGQLKIQQMAFMLLAIVIFFAMVGLFYFVFQTRGLHQKVTSLKQEKAVMLAEYLSSSAEFTCGDYCVDTDRLMVFDSDVYKEFWPVSYIKIRKIYPEDKNREVICTKANYPNCNTYNVFRSVGESKSIIGSFVALCRYERVGESPTKICDLGKLMIGYEVKW